MIACNNDGVWNEAGASVDFYILPAYYQTAWFRLACAAAVLLLLWAAYQLRVQQLKRRLAVGLEARVNERTRIARDLHDTLLQSFQGLMLRLQLVEDLLPEGKAKNQLEQTLQRADQAIAEGRRAVYDLRSSTATSTDLAQAVRSLGEEFATENSAAFHLVVEGATRGLNPIIRDELSSSRAKHSGTLSATAAPTILKLKLPTENGHSGCAFGTTARVFRPKS